MEQENEQHRLLLDTAGLNGLLKELNSRTPHRYTGVFRFQDPVLRNVALADSWMESPDLMPDSPIEQTLCAILHETGESFVSDDVAPDPRVCNYPSLSNTPIGSYCGVLLRDADGQPIGSLCHFDMKPCAIAQAEVRRLEDAAQVLQERLALLGPG